MTIALQCTCGAKLKAPDKYAGRSLKCPKCSTMITVPAAPVAAPPAAEQAVAPQALPPQQVPPQTTPQQQAPPQQPMPPQPMPPQPMPYQGQPQPGQPYPQPQPGQPYPPQAGQPYPPQQYPQYPPQPGQPQPGQPQYYAQPGQPMPGQPMPGQPMPGQPIAPGYGYPPQQAAAPVKAKKPKRKTNWWVLGGAAVVAAAIFGGALFFLNWQENTKIEAQRRKVAAQMAEGTQNARQEKLIRDAAEASRPAQKRTKNEFDSGSNDIYGSLTGSPQKLELPDLIERVKPSIVRLNVETSEGRGTGSGFFIDKEGKIATNFHVVRNANKIEAETADGRKVEVLGFVLADPKKDIAIVQIDPSSMNCIPLPLARKLPREGDPVVAFGSPQNLGFTSTEGIISAIRTGQQMRSDLKSENQDAYKQMGFAEDMKWIQTSAAISGGNSGGPLVNMQGEMVGINTWKHARGENLNFSSVMDELKKLFGTRSEDIQSWSLLPRGTRR